MSCHSQGKVGEKKVITDFSHPVDIRPSQKEITTSLPLYTLSGKVENSANGFLTCNTCHNPHQWAPNYLTPEQKSEQAAKERPFGKGKAVLVKNQEGDIHNSFLRLDEEKKQNLCTDCHKDKKYVCRSEHDLSLFASKDLKEGKENGDIKGSRGARRAMILRILRGARRSKISGKSMCRGMT